MCYLLLSPILFTDAPDPRMYVPAVVLYIVIGDDSQFLVGMLHFFFHLHFANINYSCYVYFKGGQEFYYLIYISILTLFDI